MFLAQQVASAGISVSLVAGWIVAGLGGLASAVALFKIGPERRKITADVQRAGVDATKVLSDTAVLLLQPSLDQITFLRAELATARTENAQVRTQNAEVLAQNVAMLAETTKLRGEVAALRGEIAQLRPAPGDPLTR